MSDVKEVSAARSGFRRARRVIGLALLTAGVVAAVLFVLGAWNPWRSVLLEYRFGNPMIGLLLVPSLLLVGGWLGLPVHNETRQRGRIALRWSAGAVAFVGLFGWGVFGDHFAFDAEELARSADGEFAAALVRDRDTTPTLTVHIWQGSGLGARETGEVGRVCGAVSAEFIERDRLLLSTSYGDWEITLDPQDGSPQQVLGGSCGDGPEPVD